MATSTIRSHNKSLKASEARMFALKDKTEEIIRALDVIQDIAYERYVINHAFHNNLIKPLRRGKS